MRTLLLVLLVFCLMGATPPRSINTCSCKKHSASATAYGTCSHIEDGTFCELAFDATSPDEYQRYRSALQKLGLNDDPHEVLSLANELPPDKWPRDRISNLLLVLFSVSQKSLLAVGNTSYFNSLREAAQSDGMRTAQHVFVDPAFIGQSKKTEGAGLSFFASYGCIEVVSDRFSAMVKTRWSQGCKRCTDLTAGNP